MSKTNQPLVIWVETKWLEHPKVRELAEKGHRIEDLLFHEPDAPHCEADKPDLILSETAWRWDDTKWDFLDVAIKEARRGQPVRKPKVGNDAKDGVKRRRSKGPKGSGG